jgi:hypothetical protein
MRSYITTHEIRLWCSPSGWILEIRGDLVTGEEPDGDRGGSDLCSIDAAANGVEACAVGGVGGRGDAAAGVAVYVCVAVGGALSAELGGWRERAAW